MIGVAGLAPEMPARRSGCPANDLPARHTGRAVEVPDRRFDGARDLSGAGFAPMRIDGLQQLINRCG